MAKRPKSEPGKRSARNGLALGIDVGATKVVSGLVAPNGDVRHYSGRHVLRNHTFEEVVATIARSTKACLRGIDPTSLRVGLAVAAQVDPKRGRVVYSPNLRWNDVPLAERVSEVLGTAVTLVNDARAATLAEWRYGAGVGGSDLFFLSLGTGVGGSAVVDGRLLDGSNHAVGEIGHLTIVSGGRRCRCPNTGCLEAYAGGWAIAERAREEVESHPAEGAGLLRLAGSREAITAETVFQAGRAGDLLAQRLIEETSRYLADGAVGIANAFNPSLLVVGGGLVSGRPELVDVVAAAVRTRCQPPAAQSRVVGAHLGENAGLVGAAEMARGTPRSDESEPGNGPARGPGSTVRR
ncbi:MAG: ROK family protein [Thermoplasmata archaeon]